MYQYNAKIVNVVDGDTLDIDIDLGCWCWKHSERVRLAGINTPEKFGIKKWLDKDEGVLTEEYKLGQAASDFVHQWIDRHAPDGKVTIHTVKDSTGKYGRLLAHVYSLSGRILNNDLIESGHAVVAGY